MEGGTTHGKEKSWSAFGVPPEEAHGPVHDSKWTVSPALGRRAAMKLVRWGHHGGGAEVLWHRTRELPREKVIWHPRVMNGGGGRNWEGSGTMSYRGICLKCEGKLQFYPFL